MNRRWHKFLGYPLLSSKFTKHYLELYFLCLNIVRKCLRKYGEMPLRLHAFMFTTRTAEVLLKVQKIKGMKGPLPSNQCRGCYRFRSISTYAAAITNATVNPGALFFTFSAVVPSAAGAAVFVAAGFAFVAAGVTRSPGGASVAVGVGVSSQR
ncbi:MAG: hypothetical protein C5S48_10305 [Candidatus Methanogaster sp.]|nr:MAG: hypothetical protein C5S48_10305 [ANME-2 cluster archaeon]